MQLIVELYQQVINRYSYINTSHAIILTSMLFYLMASALQVGFLGERQRRDYRGEFRDFRSWI